MSSKAVYFILILFLCWKNSKAVLSGSQSEKVNLCSEQTNCGVCIASSSECAWCTQKGYDSDNKPRCGDIGSLVRSGCDITNIIDYNHERRDIRNLNVRNAKDGQEAIQLAPQEINIRLRPNTPYKLNVTFRRAENYPVDLYYVMDLSNSMADDKARLAELGDLLANEMSKITKNFRLGFGSFVDKKTMPYVSTIKEIPCTGCAVPYGFKNQLSLTDDTRQFKKEVLSAAISGNLDAPEGGFDAIMQAIACKKEIGWRKHSRKMLMFSTDAAFHYAGDGKLGGIVVPNDGNCHLDSEGYYSESLNQDYPSISQLSKKIAEKNVNVIFAITENQMDVYKRLSKFIDGSVVGKLANDSSNIVDLVKKNYEKITELVRLKVKDNEGVRVKFRNKCLSNVSKESDACDNLGIGQSVQYEVSIEVDACPADKKEWKKSFYIYPVALDEKLKVNLELICECDCEQSGVGVGNSAMCNSSGTFECGACSCNPGRYGRLCECDGSNLESEDYNANCRRNNESEVCEGHGQCLCGTCECNSISASDPGKRYSGKFCGCDDYSCDYFENKLCGGKERGICKCGQCKCNDGFKGDDCGCPISDEPCRAKNGLVCNGKGTCLCGKCVCNLDTYYRGQTCEDCPTCPGKCEQNKACVQCKAFQSGTLTEEYCDANCSHVRVDAIADETPERKKCQFRDDDDCMFYFTYEYNSDTVTAQRTKECPVPVNKMAIALGVIISIVLIGLVLLLIWKFYTIIHDRREYAKFEKDRQNAKWDTGENPIYKQATSTFKNPNYTGAK